MFPDREVGIIKKKSVLENSRKRTDMSNKYQREIEEILRNLERTEPKAGFGRKAGERLRRKRPVRRGMSMPHFSFAEWCLVLAIVAALSAGGWAYAYQQGNLITGILALIGAIFIALVALSSFVSQPRYSSSTRHSTNITSIRPNVFRRIGTSWHLLMLKLRYRKRNNQER